MAAATVAWAKLISTGVSLAGMAKVVVLAVQAVKGRASRAMTSRRRMVARKGTGSTLADQG